MSGLWKPDAGLLALDLSVQRMAAKMLIIFFLLHTIGLLALITGRHVARYRLAFSASLRAFKCDVFSGHDVRLVENDEPVEVRCSHRWCKPFPPSVSLKLPEHTSNP